MPIASIHLGAQQAQPLQPYCSGNIAGDRQECQSCFPCSSPLALALVGNFVFQASSQAGKAPTTAQEASTGIPLWVGRSSACGSQGLGTPMPMASPTHAALLGDKGLSSKSQVVPRAPRVIVVARKCLGSLLGSG